LQKYHAAGAGQKPLSSAATVANNQVKSMRYSDDRFRQFGFYRRLSSRSISNHARPRSVPERSLLRRFGREFVAPVPETKQMGKRKMSAADQICAA
jgi:hypothetical protein